MRGMPGKRVSTRKNNKSSTNTEITTPTTPNTPPLQPSQPKSKKNNITNEDIDKLVSTQPAIGDVINNIMPTFIQSISKGAPLNRTVSSPIQSASSPNSIVSERSIPPPLPVLSLYSPPLSSPTLSSVSGIDTNNTTISNNNNNNSIANPLAYIPTIHAPDIQNLLSDSDSEELSPPLTPVSPVVKASAKKPPKSPRVPKSPKPPKPPKVSKRKALAANRQLLQPLEEDSNMMSAQDLGSQVILSNTSASSTSTTVNGIQQLPLLPLPSGMTERIMLQSQSENTPTTKPTSLRPRRKRNKDGTLAVPIVETPDTNYLPMNHDANVYLERTKKKGALDIYQKNPEIILNFIKEVLFQFQHSGDKDGGGAKTFQEFKNVWKSVMSLTSFFDGQFINPDLIHQAYYGVLGYLMEWQPMVMKLGIIFSLYLLFNCQLIQQKVPIIVTVNLWDQLVGYFNDFKKLKNYDGYHAFRSLRANGGFQFSATLHPLSQLAIFKTNSKLPSAAIIPPEYVTVDTIENVMDLDRLSSVHFKYQKSKQGNNKQTPTSLSVINPNFAQEMDTAHQEEQDHKYQVLIQNQLPGMPEFKL
ncbi:hypothetical protein DLAC_09091 [Tieghemostelium lacteum]|uniref:Uncharacterized protein n=1 Tax=Tieghemostelium lacteum TaxID=361077 RepID=A0A151Z942_TIELA|nr:hypothetical protein DLAC_09091 [Tieghemostelium lacteum]|eukprot:KYQ90468.1 hypothetical protein DLAC_09091 [Tieghemostelium lacteum]